LSKARKAISIGKTAAVFEALEAKLEAVTDRGARAPCKRYPIWLSPIPEGAYDRIPMNERPVPARPAQSPRRPRSSALQALREVDGLLKTPFVSSRGRPKKEEKSRPAKKSGINRAAAFVYALGSGTQTIAALPKQAGRPDIPLASISLRRTAPIRHRIQLHKKRMTPPDSAAARPEEIEPSAPDSPTASNAALERLRNIDMSLEEIVLSASKDARLPAPLRRLILRCASIARLELRKGKPNLGRIRNILTIQAHACCLRGKLALESRTIVLARALDLELAEKERVCAWPKSG